MKSKNLQPNVELARRGGFTLIELLAVMSIIALLAGLVLGITKIATSKAATARALADIELIKNELQQMRLDYGAFPKEASVFDGNDTVMTNATIFADWVDDEAKQFSLTDPWDSSYRYVRHTPHRCEVWSVGPDLAPGTQDDLPHNRGVDGN